MMPLSSNRFIFAHSTKHDLISSSSIESVPSSFGLIENRLSRFNNVLRNFSLRHVPAHPYLSDALSQKPIFTIAFRHFRTLANQRIKTRYRISKRMKMA
mgnify:CR=1 FL=1